MNVKHLVQKLPDSFMTQSFIDHSAKSCAEGEVL